VAAILRTTDRVTRKKEKDMSKTPESELRSVPWKKIVVPTWQQRKKPENIAELAFSLEANGQLEPVILQDAGDGTFILRAGRRRHAAFEHNGWQNREMLANVRTYAKNDVLGPIADNWIENSQRVDVSFVDQSRWVHQLVTGTYPTDDGVEPVAYDKKTVCERLHISQNYLNKMLNLVENVDEKVVEKAIEAKIPARLALEITRVKGTGVDEEEQAKSRKAKALEMIGDYKHAQDRLEKHGRKRAGRSDAGRSRKNGKADENKGFLNTNKKLDDRGYTAADYLKLADLKSGSGSAADKAYFQGMHDMLWWLTGNRERCAGFKADDFKLIE
jgi:ParB/RepB/Spo0J family partition protein